MSHLFTPAPSVSAEDLVSRLEGVRRSGTGKWTARCPAHGDKGPSLSVKAGDDGRVLLNCFAGCTFPEIVAALGMRPEQLFPPRDPACRAHRPRKPRHDPDAEARELFERLSNLRRLPTPEVIGAEGRIIGTMILGGLPRLREMYGGLTRDDLRPQDGEGIVTFELMAIFLAIKELALQGTPRRWFSPLAISRVIDWHYGEAGNARRLDVFGWCRFAVRVERSSRPTQSQRGQEGCG